MIQLRDTAIALCVVLLRLGSHQPISKGRAGPWGLGPARWANQRGKTQRNARNKATRSEQTALLKRVTKNGKPQATASRLSSSDSPSMPTSLSRDRLIPLLLAKTNNAGQYFEGMLPLLIQDDTVCGVTLNERDTAKVPPNIRTVFLSANDMGTT
jgi:hypothetical protein